MLHALLDGVVRTGEAFWAKDLLFIIERYGFVEETYFDVCTIRSASNPVPSAVCFASSRRQPNVSSASAGWRS